MKARAALILLVLQLALAGAVAAQSAAAPPDAVRNFREARDRQFRVRQQSPLADADFDGFAGLAYFPFDAQYVAAAKYEKSSEGRIFLMPTSTGVSVRYVVAGVLRFTLGGREHALTAYQSETVAAGKYPSYRNIVFVPFRDLTNGQETYGAGRFLDIRVSENGEAVVDFNFAYNPHCSYGDRFACPVPPRENFLQARIEAGEKRFVSKTDRALP